ncbi:MgtC/SapB family protein [Deinococcus alpinitundrae]|uniref:MgtC/SapB family protein n=1 Tax=Deinococcus alpinitundrae TaxID=468913 RepID=UPI00137B1A96|nr:MgtC/SapB family protein [Deinococcus alpinitundrae]
MLGVVDELELMLGPLLAFVLSGVLGWERENKQKSAGLRTHMLVGVSAALFMVLGEAMVKEYAGTASQVRFDLIGILSAVVGGVSFLGGGVIFSSAKGSTQGLTTAASLLASASVGVACGLHLYWLSSAVTLLFWFILSPIGSLSRSLTSGTAKD